MNKFTLALLLAGLMTPLAHADETSDLQKDIVTMQNPKSSDELYEAMGQFGYYDTSKLSAADKAKAYDLMFKVMDGTISVPSGNLTAAELRAAALRGVEEAIWKARDAKQPAPIANVSERLMAAASKSPDIADNAYQNVLQNSRFDAAQVAQSKSYQAVIKVATSSSNADLRADALRNLAGFFEGGDATEKFVLARLNADSSPKVKAAILSSLPSIWLMDGIASPGQKGVQRLLKDKAVQDAVLGGFDLSKKYDGKGDANHPILCATISAFDSIAETAVGVGRDQINNKSLVQPSGALLQSAITKLEANYPQPTKISCPGHTLFGDPQTSNYDTQQMDDAMKKVLARLNQPSDMGPVWSLSCEKFVPADQGGSSCEGAMRKAMTSDQVGCTGLTLKCTSAPNAYCRGQSANCALAGQVCPAAQLRTVVGDIQVCVAAKGEEKATDTAPSTSN